MIHVKLICHLKLMYCIVAVCFCELIVGCSFAFSSTLLAQLREPSSILKLNIEEESWITSVTLLVCPVGMIVIGALTDAYGKVKTLKLCLVPMFISWLLLVFAETYRTVLIGRILLGIPLGLGTCMFLYIAEVCPVHVRSLYFSTITILVGLGMMLECVLSIYFNWKTISAIMCVLSVINFFTLYFVPEPSMWLRAKGRREEADSVDEWFGFHHITPPNATSAVNNDCGGRVVDDTEDEEKSYWSSYLDRAVWKTTLVMLMFFVIQQGSGVYVLLFYSIDVIRDCRVPMDGITVSLFLSISRLLGGVCFGLLHNVKRRTMLAVSGAFMAASLFVIVLYTIAFKNVEDPPFGMTLVIAFIFFMFFALLGVLPLPWIVCGEVFPMPIKGVMNGAIQMFGYFLWFLCCKVYPSMILLYGVEYVWSIFALFCVMNVLFAIFIMPETKGKSLEEILSYYKMRENVK